MNFRGPSWKFSRWTLVDIINKQIFHIPNIKINSVRWRKWRKWMDAKKIILWTKILWHFHSVQWLCWAKIRPIRPSSPPPSSFMASNQGRRIIQNFGGSTKNSSEFFRLRSRFLKVEYTLVRFNRFWGQKKHTTCSKMQNCLENGFTGSESKNSVMFWFF